MKATHIKYSAINPNDTKIASLQTPDGLISAYVNKSVNVAIPVNNENDVIILDKNGEFKRLLRDTYLCIHIKINGVGINVSRTKLASTMLKKKISTDVYYQAGKKIERDNKQEVVKKEVAKSFENFNPEKTLIENNMIKNVGINVEIELMTGVVWSNGPKDRPGATRHSQGYRVSKGV